MFLCVMAKNGEMVSEQERMLHATRMLALTASPLVPVHLGPFFGLAAPAMVPLRPLTAKRDGLVAIGNVRLDNRRSVRLLGRKTEPNASDLDLVLAAYEERGRSCIRDMLGDFAFAVYDSRTGELVAARDTFGEIGRAHV